MFKHFDLTSLYGAAHATRQISSYHGQRATQNVALAQAVLFEGVQAQARARAAIAFINLGRAPEAEALLRDMRPRGEYLTALALVATGYLHLAKGEPMPPERVDALERTFAPVRGAWGGLALAAYGRERLGDTARCEALLAEENARVHAERLLPALPLLARWAEDRRVRSATA